MRAKPKVRLDFSLLQLRPERDIYHFMIVELLITIGVAGLRGGGWLWKRRRVVNLDGIPRIEPRILRTVPHEPRSHTQGLFFRDGELWESTGLHGHSSLRQVDRNSGKVVRSIKVSEKYYAEGAACLGDCIVQLTWRNGVALIYDVENLNVMDRYQYKGEGWGLASDGLRFYMTDGSDWLTCRSEKFNVIHRVPVKACGRRVRGLNALDYVKGRLLVNVYGLDDILVIDPNTGQVQAVISCRALVASQGQRNRGEVLNGIAYNLDTGEIYLTGKGWDRYYVVQIDEIMRPAPLLVDDNLRI